MSEAAPSVGKAPAGPARPRTVAIWAFVAILAGFLCYHLRGFEAVAASLGNDLNLMAYMLPRMAAAVLIGGFLQALIPKGLIARWLGERSGIRGLLIASAVGMVTPGGPSLAFPLVVVLRTGGASLPVLVAFLTAWSMLGVHRIIIWELPLFGAPFATVRFLSSMAMPLLAGLIAGALAGRLNGGTAPGS